MARIALKIWSAIISAFAVIAAHTPANATVAEASAELGAITVERSRKPELFLEKTVTAAESNMVVARGGGRGHASHSSHASHASHSSHYSGYGGSGRGTLSTAPSTSSETTPSTPSVGVEKSTGKGTFPSVPSVSVPEVSAKGSKATASGAAGGETGTWLEVKKVFLKGGGALGCDYVWREGKNIKVMSGGNVLTFDAAEIDEEKTFGK